MNAVDEARTLIKRQIKAIDQEAERLQRALSDLGGTNGPKPRKPRSKRASASQAGSKRAPRGQRRGQVLDAIRKQPGIKVSQIAKKLGINAQPLYAITKQLEKDGEAKKEGTGYKATPRSSAVRKGDKAKAPA